MSLFWYTLFDYGTWWPEVVLKRSKISSKIV